MENWAVELARAHNSANSKTNLFGVILYTDEHVHASRMLHDNRLWESLSRASGPEWIIYSTRAMRGEHEFTEPSDGSLGMLKAVWKEPDANLKLLASFEIPSTEHLPALLVFTEAEDGVVLKKAFRFNSDDTESAYSSLKLMFSEAETALTFLNDEEKRTNRSVFENVSSRLDAWQHVKKGIDVMAMLGRSIPHSVQLGTADTQPSFVSMEDAVFRFSPASQLWTIAWNSTPIQFVDRKGFTYLRYLLLNQNEAIHVFDLEDLTPKSKGAPPVDSDRLKQLVNREWKEGMSPEMIGQARQHVQSLRTQLDQSEDVYSRDSPELLTQREEIGRWEKFLTEQYFEPKRNPEIDKAVQRVRRNIDTALDKLRLVELGALADHLDACISRGREYQYRPQSDVDWNL